MKKIDSFCLVLATGFGSGYSPWASGTVGTLPGVALAWIIAPLSPLTQAAIVLAGIAAAIPICHRAEKIFQTKDDGRIVADEMVTFPLSLLGLSAMVAPNPFPLWFWGFAFVNHRILDILKPPPARQIQVLKGGWGIVADDVISSIYSLFINYAALRWGAPWVANWM